MIQHPSALKITLRRRKATFGARWREPTRKHGGEDITRRPRGAGLTGWNAGIQRRFSNLLNSIDEQAARERGLVGYTLTLTQGAKDMSAEEYSAAVARFEKRIKRMAGFRCCLLHTEFQERRAAHLHGTIFFNGYPGAQAQAEIARHWMEVAAAQEWDAQPVAQEVKRMTNAVEWWQYCEKHGERSAQHRQRSPESMPENWKTNSGRMWRKFGDWSGLIVAAESEAVGGEQWTRARRIAVRWQAAQLRGKIADERKFIAAERGGIVGGFTGYTLPAIIALKRMRHWSHALRCTKRLLGGGLSHECPQHWKETAGRFRPLNFYIPMHTAKFFI